MGTQLIEGSSPAIHLDITKSDVAKELVEKSVQEIASSNPLFFFSTVEGKTPHACVMVVAYDENFCLFFFSQPHTQHIRNLLKNPLVAGEIADSHQTWESPRRGIQFRGTARPAKPAEIKHVVDTYMERFPGFHREKIDPTRNTKDAVIVHPYIVRPNYLKIFDEKIFGRETWVQVELSKECPGHQ